MATPTRGPQRAIDDEALRKFTGKLIDAGVHGLFPGSSIGEFPSLTNAQHREILETVADVADGRTKILAGCCETNVSAVLEKVAIAEAAGAHAAVVVAPYYLKTTQGGLERFFTAVADQSSLPVLLYNIPQLTGNEIGVELVRRLAEHDAIVGLKDTSGDLTYHYRVVEGTPEEFVVFQGATELATASLDLGTDGLIAGPANVFPSAMADLYEAYERGDVAEARRLMRVVVAPFVSATSDLPTAAAMKHLIELQGLDVGGPLPPLPELTDEERASLSAAYRQITERFSERAV